MPASEPDVESEEADCVDDVDLQDLDGTFDVDSMATGDLARKARKYRQELRAARHQGIVAKIAEMKAARVSRVQEKVAKQRLQQENKSRRMQRVKEAEKRKAVAEKEQREQEEKAAAALEKEKKAKRRRLERGSPSRERNGTKADGRSRSSSSSSSSSVASKASSAPSEGAMAIAKALSLDSSLANLRTEQIEKVLAHQVPTEGQDPFAIAVDTEDAVALGQIMVAHSTHRAMSTLPPSVEVEQFLQLSQVDGEAAIKFRTLPYPCQKAIIDKGPIMGTRAPSSVLLARIQDVELGRTVVPERNSDGSARAVEGKEDPNARLPGMLDSQPSSAMSRGYGNQPMDQTMRAVHMAYKKLF